jgi:hypothetical protein
MTVLKVETDILNNIASSPIGQVVILGMFVKTFKTDVIVFIGNVIIYLTDNFHYQSQFVNTDNITRQEQRF